MNEEERKAIELDISDLHVDTSVIERKEAIPYAMQWINQVRNATNLRITDRNAYIRQVDVMICTLLKKERQIVRQYQQELNEAITRQCGTNPSIDDRLSLYDALFENIIDTLEEAGFLVQKNKKILTGDNKKYVRSGIRDE